MSKNNKRSEQDVIDKVDPTLTKVNSEANQQEAINTTGNVGVEPASVKEENSQTVKEYVVAGDAVITPNHPSAITPQPVATQYRNTVNPLVKILAEREKQRTETPTKLDISEYVKTTFGEDVLNDPQIQYVVATLSDYITHMSPEVSIDEVVGGKYQAKLANMYDVVLGLEPELSQVGLQIITNIVRNNIGGAFADTHSLRFANTMQLNIQQANRFQLLTVLFTTLGSGTAKKDLAKKISIRKLLDYIPDRDAKTNLTEFVN